MYVKCRVLQRPLHEHTLSLVPSEPIPTPSSPSRSIISYHVSPSAVHFPGVFRSSAYSCLPVRRTIRVAPSESVHRRALPGSRPVYPSHIIPLICQSWPLVPPPAHARGGGADSESLSGVADLKSLDGQFNDRRRSLVSRVLIHLYICSVTHSSQTPESRTRNPCV